jgi:hypothetical protein
MEQTRKCTDARTKALLNAPPPFSMPAALKVIGSIGYKHTYHNHSEHFYKYDEDTTIT